MCNNKDLAMVTVVYPKKPPLSRLTAQQTGGRRAEAWPLASDNVGPLLGPAAPEQMPWPL